MPLVKRRVVVILFGSLKLGLESTLTGSTVGTPWIGVKVGVATCRVGLDGLDDTWIAEGVVVVDGEGIDVDKWVVVELTSGNGRVIEMLLGGAMGPEGVERGLGSSETYRLLPWQANIPVSGSQGAQNWVERIYCQTIEE